MRLLKMTLVLITLTVYLCCRHKASDSGGEGKKIEPDDFQAMFHSLRLPVNFADSSLARRAADSPLASSVFSQFIADSLIQKHFGKTIKPRLYASGKLMVNN